MIGDDTPRYTIVYMKTKYDKLLRCKLLYIYRYNDGLFAEVQLCPIDPPDDDERPREYKKFTPHLDRLVSEHEGVIAIAEERARKCLELDYTLRITDHPFASKEHGQGSSSESGLLAYRVWSPSIHADALRVSNPPGYVVAESSPGELWCQCLSFARTRIACKHTRLLILLLRDRACITMKNVRPGAKVYMTHYLRLTDPVILQRRIEAFDVAAERAYHASRVRPNIARDFA